MRYEDFNPTPDAKLVKATNNVEKLKLPPIKAITNINHVGNAAISSVSPIKICIDFETTAHLISNRDFIQNYYENYKVYQTGSGEELSSYNKGTLYLPINNGNLTLIDVYYASNLGFNLLSIVLLRNKDVEIYLRVTNLVSQILYNNEILDYANPIDNQYVVRLKFTSISNAA